MSEDDITGVCDWAILKCREPSGRTSLRVLGWAVRPDRTRDEVPYLSSPLARFDRRGNRVVSSAGRITELQGEKLQNDGLMRAMIFQTQVQWGLPRGTRWSRVA